MPTKAAGRAIKAVKRRDPVARLGLAICVGILTAVSLGWWLWWRATNEPRVHLTMFFRGTVHGIEVGSPVKILGVPVGQIESMGVRLPNKDDPDYYASVKVVLDGDLLASKGLPRELDNPRELKSEIARGLRGRLQLISPITGDLYLELAYKPEDAARFVAGAAERVAEVPTLPDPLSSGILAATHRFAELEKRDFTVVERELFEKLRNLEIAADPEGVRDANDAALAKLEEVRRAVANPVLRERLAALNADLSQLRGELARYTGESGTGADRLGEIAARLRDDLAKVSEETALIGDAMNPRSPSLLLAYARFAAVRDNAAKVRFLCDEIVNANGLLASLFSESAGADTEPSE